MSFLMPLLSISFLFETYSLPLIPKVVKCHKSNITLEQRCVRIAKQTQELINRVFEEI